jgi:hypothetical protein
MSIRTWRYSLILGVSASPRTPRLSLDVERNLGAFLEQLKGFVLVESWC